MMSSNTRPKYLIEDFFFKFTVDLLAAIKHAKSIQGI